MPLQVYRQQTTPQLVGAPRANAPALVDPTGAMLSEFAGQVQKIGLDIYERQREADLQDRIGKATAEIATLELNFERDQDFRGAPQRFQEQADSILDKYLDGVTDGAVATAFKKQYQQIALAKSINVRKASWAKEKDYNVASLDANIDTYATNAANAKNPAEAALVENQARIAIASAQSGGWLSAEDAGKRERKFLEKRDSAVVIRDLSIDPSLTATMLSLDPTYAPNVEPAQRERWVDQAFRRADTEQRQRDAQAERERKRRGDELLKEAIGRGAKLTRGYVEEIKPFIEPHEYRGLLASLSGADRKDDPVAYAELQPLIYSNAVEAEARAYVLHQQGRIKNETLSSVIARAREIGRQEGPRTEYERSRQFITNAIKPSDMVRDPAGSARYALVIREFDDFVSIGKPTDKDIRERADALLKKYTMVDMVELARQTGLGAQPTPEQQLAAVLAEAQGLQQQLQTKTISQSDFNRRMATLNRVRQAAEKAANNGWK